MGRACVLKARGRLCYEPYERDLVYLNYLIILFAVKIFKECRFLVHDPVKVFMIKGDTWLVQQGVGGSYFLFF